MSAKNALFAAQSTGLANTTHHATSQQGRGITWENARVVRIPQRPFLRGLVTSINPLRVMRTSHARRKTTQSGFSLFATRSIQAQLAGLGKRASPHRSRGSIL